MSYDEDTFIHSPDGRFLKTKGGVSTLVKGLGGEAGDVKGTDYYRYRIHLNTQHSTLYTNPNAAVEQLKQQAVGADYRVKDGDLVFIKVKSAVGRDLWLEEPTRVTKYDAAVGPISYFLRDEGSHADSRARFKVTFTTVRRGGVEKQFFRLQLISEHTSFMGIYVYLYVRIYIQQRLSY